MRGILTYGAHVPYRRLDRSEIAKFFGSGGGKGTRAVASYDEDTTSMGVEAARHALRSAPGLSPQALLFATTTPTYVDKTNATTIHAALRLDQDVPAFDANGAVRSGVGAWRAALAGGGPTMVVTADVRNGFATSADESEGGDGASAFVFGDDSHAPVIAELLAAQSVTEEFTDRWRVPGEDRSRLWEERFGEVMYVPLGDQAWRAALKDAQIEATDVDRVAVTGTHSRAVRVLSGKLGVSAEAKVDDLASTVGNTGAAQPGLVLASILDGARPGQVVGLVVLADGADVFLFRVTDAIASFAAQRPVAAQVEAGGVVPYGKFLSWKGAVKVEPPRRPEPTRPSSSAAHRREDWKYGFVGSQDQATGVIHLPPARVGIRPDGSTDMTPAPMADVQGTVVTSTIDRLAYSPSPPIVFAVVDFDGGGRMPIELTDCEPADIKIGTRVEMTFRRFFTADGIANYFWKARPVRGTD
jgi:3-hydroxy-3-methylglutaryl CoA synthase